MTTQEEYNFKGLTFKQQELLSFQGWRASSSTKQPLKSTVKKLIERGLVVKHEIKDGVFTYLEYEVPIHVHIAWCQFCSE